MLWVSEKQKQEGYSRVDPPRIYRGSNQRENNGQGVSDSPAAEGLSVLVIRKWITKLWKGTGIYKTTERVDVYNDINEHTGQSTGNWKRRVHLQNEMNFQNRTLYVMVGRIIHEYLQIFAGVIAIPKLLSFSHD